MSATDPTPSVLIIGNPSDGFSYVGPFEDSEAAQQYVERWRIDSSDWWIAALTPPEVAAWKLDR